MSDATDELSGAGRESAVARGGEERKLTRYMPRMGLGLLVSGCADTQAGMLEQPPIELFESIKPAGVVAGCAHQSLGFGSNMGTDGTNHWVTRSSTMGVGGAVRLQAGAKRHWVDHGVSEPIADQQ